MHYFTRTPEQLLIIRSRGPIKGSEHFAIKGSMRIDQRSININTEIGILFYQPDLTRQSMENFDQNIEKVAFRVELVTDAAGKESLLWSGQEEGETVSYEDEPYASYGKKMAVKLMRFLPVDFML